MVQCNNLKRVSIIAMKRSHGKKFSVGIDEVGRGPLAGSVAVCALIVFNQNVLKRFPSNCDSKSISEKKREQIYLELQKEKQKKTIDYCVAHVSAAHIDRYGIEVAIQKAVAQALKVVASDGESVEVFLDGRLRAPISYTHQSSHIKGDAQFQIIGLASILAKVDRDRAMTAIHKKYPQYGFAQHKGYGTLKHRKAIMKHGITSIHRKSFLKNYMGAKKGKKLAK